MVLVREAPAKINLGLHVLRRRADGYHDLETVFCRIPWADTLEARPAQEVTLTTSDPSVPSGESNLVVRAIRALADETDTRKGAALHLEKRIPSGAGLGGGSSDAACALRLATRLWGLSVPEEVLFRLAAGLGSDVPFFLGEPCAYGTGRGEVLGTLDWRPTYPLVVVVPRLVVSTVDAFGSVRPREGGRADLRRLVCSNDLARWRAELVNDFEEPVFANHPVLRGVKEALLARGAAYASLTGTGAGVYGVFPRVDAARDAAREAKRRGHVVWGP